MMTLKMEEWLKNEQFKFLINIFNSKSNNECELFN